MMIFGPAGSSLRNSGTGLGAVTACAACEWTNREGGERCLRADRRRAVGFGQPPWRAERRMKDILESLDIRYEKTSVQMYSCWGR